ncbi:MAG: AAA family ATPase [Candidatus Daviesbacteria bacterium]|nr:MAG: AAA family ATPase [Candidatus Daviesbacteria bacterium]
MDSAQDSKISLKQKILSSSITAEIKEKLTGLLQTPGTGIELEKLISYINFSLSLPFGKFSQDILDLNRAKQILDKNHYGLQGVKERILEYLSVLILQKKQVSPNQIHAPILLFVGLVGTGKTSLAYSIAESLGRKIIRLPFGGLGEVAMIRGQSRLIAEAEPGLIVKGIKEAGVANPVILLDEIDRVAENSRFDIMGILVELLDPAQNNHFIDHYLDFPVDLSQVLFVATANNTTNLATAVLDRLEPIQMPIYSDQEKIMIGKNYLLPQITKESGVGQQLAIDDTVWPQIIRPLGYDGGIRSLSRTLATIARKVAKEIVEGKSGPFKITSQNVGEYLGV